MTTRSRTVWRKSDIVNTVSHQLSALSNNPELLDISLPYRCESAQIRGQEFRGRIKTNAGPLWDRRLIL